MAGADILNIGSIATRDDTIIKKEIYPYMPYGNSYNNSGEVRIAIQSKDFYLLPSESYIYIKFTARTSAGVHAECI